MAIVAQYAAGASDTPSTSSTSSPSTTTSSSSSNNASSGSSTTSQSSTKTESTGSAIEQIRDAASKTDSSASIESASDKVAASNAGTTSGSENTKKITPTTNGTPTTNADKNDSSGGSEIDLQPDKFVEAEKEIKNSTDDLGYIRKKMDNLLNISGDLDETDIQDLSNNIGTLSGIESDVQGISGDLSSIKQTLGLVDPDFAVNSYFFDIGYGLAEDVIESTNKDNNNINKESEGLTVDNTTKVSDSNNTSGSNTPVFGVLFDTIPIASEDVFPKDTDSSKESSNNNNNNNNKSNENVSDTSSSADPLNENKWSGTKLNAPMGLNTDAPNGGTETWYDLNMNQVVKNMEDLYGYSNLVATVRDDGVKLLSGVDANGKPFSDLVMVAADVEHMSNPTGTFKRGEIVETSLGTGIVVDYCERAVNERKYTGNVHFDIATAWHTGEYQSIAYSKNNDTTTKVVDANVGSTNNSDSDSVAITLSDEKESVEVPSVKEMQMMSFNRDKNIIGDDSLVLSDKLIKDSVADEVSLSVDFEDDVIDEDMEIDDDVITTNTDEKGFFEKTFDSIKNKYDEASKIIEEDKASREATDVLVNGVYAGWFNDVVDDLNSFSDRVDAVKEHKETVDAAMQESQNEKISTFMDDVFEKKPTEELEEEKKDNLPKDSVPIDNVPNDDDSSKSVDDVPNNDDSSKPVNDVDPTVIPEVPIEELSVNPYTDVPLVFQSDYPNVNYGGRNKQTGQSHTIATAGCGITSLAMLYGYYNETEFTPVDVIDKSGYYGVESGGTGGEFITKFSKDNELPLVEEIWYNNEDTVATVSDYLSKGYKVIANVVDKKDANGNKIADSVFTESGHYIVLTGVTDDGKIKVNDPNKYNYKEYNKDASAVLTDGFENGFDTSAFTHGKTTRFWIYAPKN